MKRQINHLIFALITLSSAPVLAQDMTAELHQNQQADSIPSSGIIGTGLSLTLNTAPEKLS